MQRDIAYGADPEQKLDIYHPGTGGIAPLVVFLHGGGWTRGSKNVAGRVAPLLLRHGYAVAGLDYRLVPRTEQMVAGLSYANRRRIEIARALASRPRILLLDEPTAGMNPAETLELAEQIKSLNDLGLTVLLIEHKLDVVTRLADTVYVLDHGDVIAAGKPDEVRKDEEVLRAYLGRNAQAAAAGVT